MITIYDSKPHLHAPEIHSINEKSFLIYILTQNKNPIE